MLLKTFLIIFQAQPKCCKDTMCFCQMLGARKGPVEASNVISVPKCNKNLVLNVVKVLNVIQYWSQL